MIAIGRKFTEEQFIHVVVPTLRIDESFIATIRSLSRLEDLLGRIIVVAPAAVCEEADVFTDLGVEFFPEKGKGVYCCFNQAIAELGQSDGYVLFLGAGDCVVAVSDCLRAAMLSRSDVIMTGIIRPDGPNGMAGKPEHLFRTKGCFLARLPHHQGMLYRMELIRNTLYPENFGIYGDVVQRARALKAPSCVSIDLTMVETAEAGVSNYKDWRRIWKHLAERAKLSMPLILMGEPLLAVRYFAGSFKVMNSAIRRTFHWKNVEGGKS